MRDKITEDAPFAIVDGWLVGPSGRCTCEGPYDIPGVDHHPSCGTEPLISLAELERVLALAGRTVVELPVFDELAKQVGSLASDTDCEDAICVARDAAALVWGFAHGAVAADSGGSSAVSGVTPQ
jgi:hypothetical protein